MTREQNLRHFSICQFKQADQWEGKNQHNSGHFSDKKPQLDVLFDPLSKQNKAQLSTENVPKTKFKAYEPNF